MWGNGLHAPWAEDLVEAASHPTSARARTELLAAVTEPLPVGVLGPFEIALADDVWMVCHTFAPLGHCSGAQSPCSERAGQDARPNREDPMGYSPECVEGLFSEVRRYL